MRDLQTSLRLWVVSLLVCCAAYPLIVLGVARLVAPEASQGSLIRDDQGTIRGSRLIAQSFSQPHYFWPRPSAVDYDAGAAGGSNHSPTNPEIAQRAQAILARYALSPDEVLPAEMVTTSGSGLDPDITLAAAAAQLARVAEARGVPLERLQELVVARAESRTLATLEEGRLVNVLELNLALDREFPLK